MEGSVSNVQFTERKRGFDPDEVANYLAHIDDKIAGLRAIAAEALERAEQAEERARVAEQRVSSADEGPAQAAGVLAMAQQTADATVSQAQVEADSLLARAHEDADRHRLAAEAEAQQLLADTRRELEARRAEHLETLRQEIDALAGARDAVAADIRSLEEHLATQRARVLESRDALTRLVEDPAALQEVPVPATSEVGDVLADVAAGDVVVEEVMVADVVVTDEQTGAVVAETVVEDVVVSDAFTGEVLAEAIVEDVVITDPASGEVVAEMITVESMGTESADLTWANDDPVATAPVAAVGGLFDDDAVDEPPVGTAGGPESGIFSPDAAGTTPETVFGSFDAEDDEAMRAFFEGDVDDDDRPGRWGFRRR